MQLEIWKKSDSIKAARVPSRGHHHHLSVTQWGRSPDHPWHGMGSPSKRSADGQRRGEHGKGKKRSGTEAMEGSEEEAACRQVQRTARTRYVTAEVTGRQAPSASVMEGGTRAHLRSISSLCFPMPRARYINPASVSNNVSPLLPDASSSSGLRESTTWPPSSTRGSLPCAPSSSSLPPALLRMNPARRTWHSRAH